MEDEKISAHGPKAHRTDAFAQKLEAKAETFQSKKNNKKEEHGLQEQKKEDGPAGGFDDTKVPHASTGFTVKFTFHRAHNLPFADLNSLSSDPYVVAQLNTHLPMRHKQDPRMRWRTPTIRRNVEPVWDAEWIVANVPASGFALKARIYDEDPADHDDRLGNVHVHVDRLFEGWEGIREREYKIKKRMGSKRAYALRGCAAMFKRGVQMSGELVISVELLGRTESREGRVWTVGPCNWTQHLSPMIGRLIGTKDSGEDNKDGKSNSKYK